MHNPAFRDSESVVGGDDPTSCSAEHQQFFEQYVVALIKYDIYYLVL